VTNYFEWIGSGFIEGKGYGTAMHEAVFALKDCCFGFNETSLFLRVDLDKRFMNEMDGAVFEVSIIGKDDHKIEYHVRDGSIKAAVPVQAAFDEILELCIPFSDLGLGPKDEAEVWFSLKINEMIVDRIPQRGYLVITVPSETFEAEMWYV